MTHRFTKEFERVSKTLQEASIPASENEKLIVCAGVVCPRVITHAWDVVGLYAGIVFDEFSVI